MGSTMIMMWPSPRAPHRLMLTTLLVTIVAAGCAQVETSGQGRFRSSGRSDDLLCAFPQLRDQRLPDWITDSPEACDCGAASGVPCYHIDIDDDRRRALVLSSPARVDVPVDVGEARWLRFAVAALGHAVDVHITVGAGHPAGASEWQGQLRPDQGWTEAGIELTSLAGSEATVTVRVTRRADPMGFLALAAPRLVTPSGTLAGAGPTNIVVYMIDTLRADHTSLYGYDRATTPRLEQIGRAATVFERAYSPSAWTRPSTGSLFTSLYSRHHGAHSMQPMRRDVVTLAERFRAAGWSTWAFVTNGHVLDRHLNFDQGFDRFAAIRGVRGDNHARTEEVNAVLLPHLDQFADEPFFLYVHVVDPHSPYDPPERYRGLFTNPAYAGTLTPEDTVMRMLGPRTLSAADLAHVRALYDEDIRYQDDMLGVFVDRLQELKLAEQTLLVVTSDHGEEFLEHGHWEHGGRLFEEQVLVPLVVSVPGVPALAGRRVRAPVQIMDVMPTLLGWYGIGGRDACQGRDLSPLLLGLAAGVQSRPIYLEEIRWEQGAEVISLTEGSWKIIHQRARDTEQFYLFDLAADPGEQESRVADDPQRLATLKAKLSARVRELSRSSPELSAARPAPLDEATRKQLRALGYLDAEQQGEAPP